MNRFDRADRCRVFAVVRAISDRPAGRGRILLQAILAIAICAAPLQAENWPQWRGPAHNGISAEKHIAAQWDRETNVAWRLPLPGMAGSTPAIWDDRIFLTSGDEDGNLLLLCISTDGNELWRKRVGTGDRMVGPGRNEGNLASPSPSTDGKHVWAFMGTGDLACFDIDGNEVWRVNLQQRYGRFDIQFGMTSTPLLYEDKLFLQIIHGPMRSEGEPAYVAALDKLTGEEVWKHDRKTGAQVECKHAYTSPALYDDGKSTFLLTHGADYIIAHRLGDGKELWRHGGLNPPGTGRQAGARQRRASDPGALVRRFDTDDDGKVHRSEIKGAYLRLFDAMVKRYKLDPEKTYTVEELQKTFAPAGRSAGGNRPAGYHPTLRFVASPAVAPGMIVVPSAKGGPVLAIRPNLEGDATGSEDALIWKLVRGTPDVPAPLIHGGLVYLCAAETGVLTCVDAASGEQVYQERFHRATHRASPVYADGNVYLTARDGVITVVKAGREFEIVAQNDLEEEIAASPAISDGTLYLRSFDALWAIRN